MSSPLTPLIHILLINGPNLNLLGIREPQIYGSTTITDVGKTLTSQCETFGAHLSTFQTNHEGAILDRIHTARQGVDAIIINPGGVSHTTSALLDALLADAKGNI